MIQASGLTKSYRSDERRVEVLRGVDITVEQGEMVAIVGSSGVGKSTLMHLLGTLDVPDAGSVLLGGQDVFDLDEEARDRLRNETIGFIFQFHHLLPEFTALENVAMPLLIPQRAKGAKRAQRDEADAFRRANALLSELGLGERAAHRPAQLSGGEQQRVAVARALVTEPSLVLADEPTGNLDTKNSFELVALFRDLHAKRGLTSVIVTHSEAIAAVCDRTLYMEDGKVRPADG